MPGDDRKLTAVMVGTAFGLRAHVPALQLAGYDIVALVGRDPEKTARRAGQAGIPNGFTSLDAALDLEPDLVCVTTGPAEHYPLSARALDAGCHVMCEKPFTLDLGQARDLQQRAEAKGLVAYIAHEFRYSPALALLGQVIKEGAVGEPRLATIVAHTQLLADPDTPRPDWWFDEERGGGWLGASGSHGIDLIRGWLGEIDRLACRLSVTSDRTNVADDSFCLSFVTRSGVEGQYQSSCGTWGRAEVVVRVAGPKGTAWIDDTSGAGNVESTSGPVMVATREGTREVPVPAELERPQVPPESMRVHSVPLFLRNYTVMAEAIRGRAPTGPVRPATFADGIAEMTALDAARLSSREGGRWVEIQP